MKWNVVIGRRDGDDEDTAAVYEADDAVEPFALFRYEMGGDDAVYEVYVNYLITMEGDTPPVVECFV